MSKSVRYQGPLPLLQAKSKLICTPLDDSRFHREGPRANVEYRDLGMPWSVCELQWTGGHSSEWFRLLPMRLR